MVGQLRRCELVHARGCYESTRALEMTHHRLSSGCVRGRECVRGRGRGAARPPFLMTLWRHENPPTRRGPSPKGDTFWTLDVELPPSPKASSFAKAMVDYDGGQVERLGSWGAGELGSWRTEELEKWTGRRAAGFG